MDLTLYHTEEEKKQLKFLIVTFVWMEQTERVLCFSFLKGNHSSPQKTHGSHNKWASQNYTGIVIISIITALPSPLSKHLPCAEHILHPLFTPEVHACYQQHVLRTQLSHQVEQIWPGSQPLMCFKRTDSHLFHELLRLLMIYQATIHVAPH